MEYNTKEKILATGKIDPELAAVLKELNLPPMDYSDLSGFQEMVAKRNEEMLAALGSPPPSVKQTDHDVPIYDGSTVRARVYQPVPPPAAGSPLIVLYHGGGFCFGSPEGEERPARNFVEAFGAVCVSSAYQLAPKHPFPASPKSAWDTLRWAAKNAESFGADPSLGFVVGGTSAGGNLSAVLSILARDEGLNPPLTGQYLAIPAICPSDVVPDRFKDVYLSMEQNANAPVLPQAAIDMFMNAYKPDHHSDLFAPLNAAKGHKGLPKAYFQINGLDPLRDEGLIYERVLREESGVQTRLDMYPGLPHGFWAFFAMLKSADRFKEDMVRGMGWLLGREPEMEKITTAKPEAQVV